MSPPIPLTFSARLVESRPLGPRARHLEFERSDGASFVFEPGQWVQLTFPINDERGKPIRRSYSIASAPVGTPRFSLAVTQVDAGAGSGFLCQAELGLNIDVKGPSGTFTRGADHAALMIATGSGVAPFRSMMLDAVARGISSPLWLLLGARSPEEVLYSEELSALARSHSNIRFIPSLSRADESWTGRRGYVQLHVAELWKELNQGFPQAHAYICGVRKMLLTVRDVLRDELGVERKSIHLEAYD